MAAAAAADGAGPGAPGDLASYPLMDDGQVSWAWGCWQNIGLPAVQFAVPRRRTTLSACTNMSSTPSCPWVASLTSDRGAQVCLWRCVSPNLQGFADYGLEEPSLEGLEAAPVPRINWAAMSKEEIVSGPWASCLQQAQLTVTPCPAASCLAS